MINKINIDRNIARRENRFFRAIINKLEASSNCKDCYEFEKEEVYRNFDIVERKKYTTNYNAEQKAKRELSTKQMCAQIFPNQSAAEAAFASASAGYELKQKISLNIDNNAFYSKHVQANHKSLCKSCAADIKNLTAYNIVASSQDYLQNPLESLNHQLHSEIPIRYTFSDSSLCDAGLCVKNSSSSCTNLMSVFSPRFLNCNIENLKADFFLKVSKFPQ